MANDNSTDDLVNQLLTQTTVTPQPSFMGLQAPPDQGQLQALLGKLRQKQFLDAYNAPTQGEYGYLHDAGKQNFGQAGQILGTMLTQPRGFFGGPGPANAPQAQQPQQVASQPQAAQPSDADSSGAPATQASTPQAAPSGATAAIGQALQKGRQVYTSMINNGVDPDVATLNTMKLLTSLGVPGADAKLAEAQQQVLKNQATQAETKKNTSQSAMDDSDVTKNAAETDSKQWKTTFTDPSGLFLLQTNQSGEVKRVELKPPPSAAAQMAANLDPSSIQFAADTYRTTGKFPGSFARNPAMQAAVLKQVAADAAANGDTAGSIAARTASLKAGGMALDQVSKQEAFTSSAVNTLDKNLTALQTIGSKVDDSGSPLVNTVINHWNQGVVTDKNTAAYVAMLNAVQGEYAKIASNNNGNSPISDSAKADAKEVINKAMSQGGIAAVAQVMRQESQNRMQAIREAKQGLISGISGNAPSAGTSNAPSAATGATSGPATSPSTPTTLPPVNGQGWTLHQDAKGNRAYVSPDGTKFQAVQ